MTSHQHKRFFTRVQILWATAGLIMLGGAALVFVRQESELAQLSTSLGLAMLSVGNINIAVYVKKRKTMHGARWLLADGMSTALLSFFLLFNQMIYSALIPFFFGVWELFSGVLKVMDSMELRNTKVRGWHRFAVVGMTEILFGTAALLKPVDDFVGMHIVVAIVFLVQSFGFLFKILMYPHIMTNEDLPR